LKYRSANISSLRIYVPGTFTQVSIQISMMSFHEHITVLLSSNYSSLFHYHAARNSDSPNSGRIISTTSCVRKRISIAKQINRVSLRRGRCRGPPRCVRNRLVAKQQSTSVDSATARTASDIECETPNQHPHIRDTLT
jgi:hypothetical protein